MSDSEKLRLLWTAAARLDVIRLRAFLEGKNKRAAQNAAAVIRKGIDVIVDNPYLSSQLEGREDREFFVPFGKNGYVLRYRIEAETILLLRIWHSRENR